MNAGSLPSQARQLTIRQLLAWTTFLACYFTIAANLANHTKSIAAGILVALVFICIDSRRKHKQMLVLSLSYFACGLAYCIATMFFILVYFPDPTPPRPPMPFFAGLVYVVSGQWLDDVLTELGRALAMIFQYFFAFALFTLVSSALAIPYARKCSGWKIILANAPGLLFLSYIALAIAWDAFQP